MSLNTTQLQRLQRCICCIVSGFLLKVIGHILRRKLVYGRDMLYNMINVFIALPISTLPNSLLNILLISFINLTVQPISSPSHPHVPLQSHIPNAPSLRPHIQLRPLLSLGLCSPTNLCR